MIVLEQAQLERSVTVHTSAKQRVMANLKRYKRRMLGSFISIHKDFILAPCWPNAIFHAQIWSNMAGDAHFGNSMLSYVLILLLSPLIACPCHSTGNLLYVFSLIFSPTCDPWQKPNMHASLIRKSNEQIIQFCPVSGIYSLGTTIPNVLFLPLLCSLAVD